MKSKILIIEDDTAINHMIRDLLTQNGYETLSAFSGTEALRIFEEEAFDLVLLDLMLPGLAGEAVLAKIRAKSNLPVIGVTAKSDTTSTVELLRSGADDYLIKPFDNEELLARIEAQLRRSQQSTTKKDILRYKDLTINIDSYTVFISEQEIHLTKREFLILKLLMSYPKKVFTKNNLYENVWENELYVDDNTINVHVSNLRSKLAEANPSETYIETVWGIGFKMADE